MDEKNVVANSDKGCMLFAFNKTKNIFEYLVPVRSIPATGGAPAQIEVTEMDSDIKQYILDRQETSAYEFDYNYTANNYKKCKEFLDGKSENTYLITYSDKSGVKFKGIGATWRDAVGIGSEIKAKISIAITSKEDVDDCSSIIDIGSIPSGKTHPFATNSVVVKFDLNGGTGTPIEDISCIVGKYINVPSCDAVLDTEDVNCWNTSADGTGTDVAFGNKFFPTEDTTLYAKYTNTSETTGE